MNKILNLKINKNRKNLLIDKEYLIYNTKYINRKSIN